MVLEAFRSGEGLEIYTQPFEPVVTDRVVIQLFENLDGIKWDYATIGELAPMRCKAEGASPSPAK